MKCQYCGFENEEGAKYCAGCGEKIIEAEYVEPVIEQESPHVPKCFDVFAKLGFGLGLGGLIGCIFFGLGYIACVPGIVFSALGKKSIEFHSKANVGLILSIIGTIVGFLIYVIFIAVISILFDTPSYY